ncbi:histidinol-phosphate transaminase [Mangrovibacterium marinum]|uniref:Aminotransferase n=1 Tax=Mangrovibacterium marinum TaxID=1639118 RepID=A0A2T5C5Y6_9BACT|nr:histidinol-phosphate transaminase [Mangrovibacterium marinum]PTN10371.1 histidinol-phosphate/aromatic aminotransferase/cobyric acid decarboxylase-like protein [Mangrovibacterium marinum]
MTQRKFPVKKELFLETTHSPALVDIVGEEFVPQVVDFCFIANPYYPTPEMMRELLAKIPEIIKAYPSSNPRLAREQLAEVLHINPDFLILGNGATELITLIEQELIDDIAIPVPTFSEYLEKLRKPAAARLFQLPEDQNYDLDLNAFGDWIDQQQISSALIINPGNPTGQFIALDELKAFLTRMAHLKVVLLDESFIDFSGVEQPSIMPFLEAFQNVIVVRSMSKHCGVPGLRLGYCCTANPDFVSRLGQLLPIWNINTIAEYFLLMLPRTDAEYQDSVRRVVADVQLLYRKLKVLDGYKIYPTGSNFILIRIDYSLSARALQMRLLEDYGLYVRDCSNKIGLDDFHIRVASQGERNDERLVKALAEIRRDYEASPKG